MSLRTATRVLALVFAVTLREPQAFAGGVTPPVAEEQPAAVWPHAAPGSQDIFVPVLLIVSATGAVTDAKVEDSIDPEFAAAALEAARRWRFRPALVADKPVAAKVRVSVRFAAQTQATAPPAAEQTSLPAPPSAGARAVPATREPATTAETQVIVTGERAPPPARSATEITQERRVLSAAPHRTASDLLQTVPGIALTQHSGEGAAHQIFFRGFDAVHGQDLEIWAGGAPVNDVSNIHGQGYADLNFLPPEVVQRIHSAPGTYDPRQGDFAVAGSLALDLGYAEPGVTAKFSLGQFDTRRYFVGYHPPGWSDATFGAFEFYSTDGFGPSRATRRTSAVGQIEFPVGDVTARIMASGSATTFASPGVLLLDDIESGRVDRFGTYDEHQGGDAARSQLVFELGHGDADARWSFAPYVVLRSMRLREDYTGYLVVPYNGTAAEVAASDAASAQGNSEQQINDASTFGFKAFYRRTLRVFSQEDSLEAGVSTRYDRIEQSQKKLSVDTSQVTLDEVDAKINATDAAGYLDLALHPHARVALRGGLRIDGLAYVTEDNGGQGKGERRSAQGAHLGKKATLDVRVVSDLHAVASYGDGFRSPQARSLQELEDAPFTSVQSYEAGLRYHTPKLRMTASVFRTLLSDDLAFNAVTAREERTPPTDRTGTSVEFAAEPTKWFTAAASFTYTHAQFTNTDGGYNAGDLLPYAPQIVIRTDAAFTPELGQVLNRPLTGHFGIGETGIARRPLPYGEMGHNVWLVDAVASVRLREIELGITAYNLFNVAWYDGEYVYASNFHNGAEPSLVPQRHVTVGAPRSVLANFSLYL